MKTDPRGRNVVSAESEVVGDGKKREEKEMPGTHVKRRVSMAVRFPNGRSPRQPLRTLCSLLPAIPFTYLSLFVYLSFCQLPHSLHPSHASAGPHHSTRRFLGERGYSRIEIWDKFNTMGLFDLLPIHGIL